MSAESLAPGIRRIEVEAPPIARRHRPGQFVIVRVTGDGERIPLTIADSDPQNGSITLIVQEVGRSTRALNRLEAGDQLNDVAGPLGRPSEIGAEKTAVVVGGGLGAAIVFPLARELRANSSRVIAIIGGRSKPQVLLEDELEALGVEVVACTDDGSYGRPGLVTEALEDFLTSSNHVDVVFAAGPVAMMRAVAEVTRRHAIRTIASLNPIMVDGTGMCGGCRVEVGGETKFACVDGPEFNAHLVDFDLLERRNRAYLEFESGEGGPCRVDLHGSEAAR